MIVKLIDLASSIAQSDDKALLDWLLPKFLQALSVLPYPDQRVATLTLLDRLRFKKSETLERLETLFEHLVLPLMIRCLERDHVALALLLELVVYEEYIKRVENEDHFQRCVSRWAPAMEAAGVRMRDRLPPLPSPPFPRVGRTVAFYLHNASLLAHVQMLLGMLDGYARLDNHPYRFRVYVGKRGTPDFEVPFRQLDIPIVYISDHETVEADLMGKCLVLRELLTADGVDCLVWISRVDQAAIAFSLGMAPHQVFWAMKYHSFMPPNCRLGLSSLIPESGRELLGHTWHGVFFSKKDWFKPGLSATALRVREHYPAFSIILGTLGRDEKIRQPAFLETVLAILKANPRACFLWTGRAENPEVKAFFHDGGVAGQCFFIGWVDTALYAQVIDIFLDSFPFGCGYTLMETMAAAKPAVFMALAHPEHLINFCNVLVPLIASPDPEGVRFRKIMGDVALPVARDQAEYIQLVQALIDDGVAGKALGRKLRVFVEEFASDNERSARQFVQHMEHHIPWPSSPSC